MCQLAPPAEQLYKRNLQEYLTAKVALAIRISIPSSNGQRQSVALSNAPESLFS